MKRNPILLFLKICVCSIVVVANEPMFKAAIAAEDKYKNSHQFSNASKLRLKFLGYSDLTGDYQVENQQIITIPVLGRFSIKGITASDFEKLLAEKTTEITKRDAYVSVEIIEYKPIFVTGFVQRPGSTQWRPGMTVIHAVSISGGFFRSTITAREPLIVVRAVESELNQIKSATANLKLNIAIRARLETELSDDEIISVPQSLIELVGKLEAEALIKFQNTVLKRNRDAFRSQIALFENGVVEANNRILSLESQKKLMDQQIQLQQSIVEGIKRLWQNKTVNSSRLASTQMELMNLQAQLSQINIALSNAKTRIISLKQEIGRAKLLKHQTLSARLEVLRREAAQLKIDIDAAKNAYRRLVGLGKDAGDANSTNRTNINFRIMRQTPNGKLISLNANESTLLETGDILIVSNSIDNSQISNKSDIPSLPNTKLESN